MQPLAPGQPLALGIDIGGTNTTFGLVDRRGNITARGRLRTRGHENVQAYIRALRDAAQPFLAETGIENLAGCGIGAPNANYYTGEVAHAANLSWEGVVPLARLVEEALGLKTTVTNDANAATLGEMEYGAAKGMKDFILVTLGTGVGSGFVANGQLIYGHDGFAGELGHTIAVRDGRSCGCGRHGCLETYASATGIVRSAQEWLAEQPARKTALREIPKLSAWHIHQAAGASDTMATELFEFTGKILGQSLADAVAITSPQAIIFFGGLAKAGPLLLEPVRRHMEANLLRMYKGKVALLQSALQDSDAAILGASALVW
jgi:glucokinase